MRYNQLISRFRIPAVLIAGMLGWGFANPSFATVVSKDSVSVNDTATVPAVAPDFSRYTPAMCLQPTLLRLTQVRLGQSTVYRHEARELYPAEYVSAVETCLSRFSADTLSVWDAFGLGRSYAVVGKPDRANAIFSQLVQKQTPKSPEQAWLLVRIVEFYATEGIGDATHAESYLGQLTQFGDLAASDRMLAHLAAGSLGMQVDSIALWDRESQAALTIARKLHADSIKKYAGAVLSVYQLRADYHVRIDEFDSVTSLFKEAENVLRRLRPRFVSSVESAQVRYGVLGKPASPLEVSRWVNLDGQPPVFPGKTSLLVFVRHNCGTLCEDGYKMLKTVIEQIPGLQVVLSANTGGYHRTSLVLPDEEARLLGEQFKNTLGISAPIAVWETTFSRRDMDGRMLIKRTPNSVAYLVPTFSQWVQEPIAFVIDRSATIRRVFSLSLASPALLMHSIRDIMQESVGPVSAALN